ncbi:glutamine synthetase family protein [Rhodovibrionaceae bacterium A322]
MSKIEEFLKEHRIEEVECLVPDMAGIARGKILPAHKFLAGMNNRGLRLPESVFVQTVTGSYPEEEKVQVTNPATSDVFLIPDPSTIRLVPWYTEPTAQIICDAIYHDGTPVPFSARQVLKRIVSLFDDMNITPIVAAEMEFYLVDPTDDHDYPLRPPIGRSGRRETSRQAYGVDAVNEFDPMFEEIYDFCEAQGIDIDTLIHESGAAQMEMNFDHCDALLQADQAFLFKRTVREAGLRHKVFATFMAKPMQGQPGSSMHLHQSLVSSDNGENLFATKRGRNSALFMNYIGGLQRYLPAALPLFAPNVNSYRRLIPDSDAPINTHWGIDNRTVGLRVPYSDNKARRVENRMSGADANPYLAIAGSLACGYLGMTEKRKPRKPVEGDAYRLAHTLPRTLYDSLNRLTSSRPLKQILGEEFVLALQAVKEAELDAYQEVISSWEREHLLLNV